jgi:nitrate reductase NapE component
MTTLYHVSHLNPGRIESSEWKLFLIAATILYAIQSKRIGSKTMISSVIH